MPRRRSIGGFVACLALVSAATGLGAGTASAHDMGKAVVLIRGLSLAPVGEGWQATATVADLDSGSPLENASVVASTGNPLERTALAATAVAGQYQGTVQNARPGSLQLELQVTSMPGGNAVRPYDHTWNISLVAGATNEIVKHVGDGRGDDLPLIIGVAASVLTGAVLYGMFSVRRRTPVPAPAK